ncbi:MAG: hypothetical protein Q8K53_00345, partial [Daejeonella sp.]|nr:hypothetical protein [Daejeonella sp.]
EIASLRSQRQAPFMILVHLSFIKVYALGRISNPSPPGADRNDNLPVISSSELPNFLNSK